MKAFTLPDSGLSTEIRRSVSHSVMLVVFGFVFYGVSIWLIDDAWNEIGGGSLSILHGLFLIYAGFTTVFHLERLLFSDEAPIRFSSNGFRDTRFMKTEVSWRNVQEIRTSKNRGHSRLHVLLSEGGANEYAPTRMGRLAQALMFLNLGSRRICFTSNDLDVTFPQFEALFEGHFEAFKSEVEQR